MKNSRGGMVYSSEHGRMCPDCGRATESCACRRGRAPSPAPGPVRIVTSSAGRKGKVVTVVSGLPLAEEALAALAGELKRRCATGGTVKNGTIEIQGEHRAALVAELLARGYKAR